MKKLLIVSLFAAAFVGCSEKPTEAQLFGYKGQDLEDKDDKMFFSTGPGVTNWVPTRVLSVFEQYDFTADELAVIAAAGVIQPSKALKTIPEGYVEKSKEPWFTNWSRDNEAFGRKGVAGFISHWNEEQKEWETGETYFSSYYDSEAQAVAALGELEQNLVKFNPKKFHRFEKCWIAEYVRLRVMGLAGQRPDGTWTCMLDIQDKCDTGCGQWEPVEAQQERVDEVEYHKLLTAWKAEVAQLAKRNHEAVQLKARELKLPLFGEGVEPRAAGDGRMVYVDGGMLASNVVAQSVWDEKAAALESATGAKLSTVMKQDEEMYTVWSAVGTNELFTVRLDMALSKPSTNTLESAPAPETPGEWRQLCFENVMPGFVPPPAPQRKRR